MTQEQQIIEATCGVSKMVYSKYQVDRYGLKEGKNKYNPFKIKKLQLKKELIDFGIPCQKLRIIKPIKLPFLSLEDATCAVAPNIAFEFIQAVACTMWFIEHNLGFNPNVTVVDNDGYTLDPVIQYLSDGVSLKVMFSIPIAGKAYLS